MYIYIVKED